MSSDAVTKDQNGLEEHTGLSLLDIVKHSAKTLISMLDENDYVSIISYSSYARDRIKMLKMTSINKNILVMTSIIVFTCSITDTFHQLKIQNLQVRFQSEGAI